MELEHAEQALRLMRRAVLLSYAGRHAHARGQIAAARGRLAMVDTPVVRDPESWQAVAAAGRKHA